MTSSESNIFNQYLKGLELDSQKLEEGDYDEGELYWLSLTGKEEVKGPFWMFDLKDYLQKQGLEHGPQIGELNLCPYNEDPQIPQNWLPIFEHPFFQRRLEDSQEEEKTPKSIENLFEELSPDEETFHILLYGQKSGPYSFEQIKEMLHSKQVLVTDMISIDNGKSWGRLYEIEEFDRRYIGQGELPFRPDSDPKSKEEIKKKLQQKWQKKQEGDTQAIAGLAYVENIRSGKVNSTRDDVKIDEPLGPRESFMSKIFYASVLGFSVVGMAFLLWPGQDPDNTSLKPTSTSTQVQKLEPTERFDPRERREQQKRETASSNTSSSQSESSPQNRRNRQKQIGEREESNRDRSFSRESTPFRQSETYKRAQRQREERNNTRPNRRSMREPASVQVIESDREDLYYDDASGSLELDPVRETLSREIIDPVDEHGDYYHNDYREEYIDNSSRRVRRRTQRNVSSFPPADDFDNDSYSDESYNYDIDEAYYESHYDEFEYQDPYGDDTR